MIIPFCPSRFRSMGPSPFYFPKINIELRRFLKIATPTPGGFRQGQGVGVSDSAETPTQHSENG